MKRLGKKVSLLLLVVCLIVSLRFEGIAADVKGEGYLYKIGMPLNQNNNFEYRAQVFQMDDAYVIVDPSEIVYINDRGKPIWKKPLASQNVGASVSDNWMALCERKSGDVFVIDNSGKLLAEKFGLGPIETLKVLNDKYLAVLKKNRELLVMDKELKVHSTTMLPKGKIVDFGLNPQSSEIVLGLLDLSRSDFNTKILFTDMQGNIKSGSHIYEAIPYDLQLNQSSIAMVVDTGFLFYNYRGEKISEAPVDRTIQNFMFHESGDIYVHLLDESSSLDSNKPESQIVAYDAAGNVLFDFIPPFKDIVGMRSFGDGLLLYNRHKIAVSNAQGKVVQTYAFKEEVESVLSADGNSFAVAFVNRLDIYVKQ